MLESSYRSQQSGVQAIINAEPTLARWMINSDHHSQRDHMKTLHTCLTAAGLAMGCRHLHPYP